MSILISVFDLIRNSLHIPSDPYAFLLFKYDIPTFSLSRLKFEAIGELSTLFMYYLILDFLSFSLFLKFIGIIDLVNSSL